MNAGATSKCSSISGGQMWLLSTTAPREHVFGCDPWTKEQGLISTGAASRRPTVTDWAKFIKNCWTKVQCLVFRMWFQKPVMSWQQCLRGLNFIKITMETQTPLWSQKCHTTFVWSHCELCYCMFKNFVRKSTEQGNYFQHTVVLTFQIILKRVHKPCPPDLA